MNYLYLHGFASGPQSQKAQYLCDRIQSLGFSLQIPDLNQDDFLHLTLSRQIQQVHQILDTATPWTIIGSSFGGLTAAWVAQRQPAVQQLILLAPAFGFLNHWLPILGEAQRQQWQEQGTLAVYHHSAQQALPLSYRFFEDLSTYRDDELQRPVPTLILHGTQDTTIPITASEKYAVQRSGTRLIPLETDHAMTDALEQIWTEMKPLIKDDNHLSGNG
ncbi:hypothetical protein C1752_00482 [Acaryochloris thomasi RCC1774]|uniref:Esterase n=1 Tax=Acaryochloris thomasi RCC1774 TaxID=1764569 RepID=A0A2W1JPP1_9CYAN|nr:YqiA/YcfP family alpha/beta fold hydrolase [Acaryochloris thomasi]PZD75283.1 hypothetical protein C1752_00482 [Acaryochloris thomasi RCC1774]